MCQIHIKNFFTPNLFFSSKIFLRMGDFMYVILQDGKNFQIFVTASFPPEPPTPGIKGCFLFRLLRPELVFPPFFLSHV